MVVIFKKSCVCVTASYSLLTIFSAAFYLETILTACLFTCVLLMVSHSRNSVLWTTSASCAYVLQMVSHWFGSFLPMLSCCLTCVWMTPGWDARQRRSGGTWLPGEFPAPLSWRHRSSAQNGMRMPVHSEEVTTIQREAPAEVAFSELLLILSLI